MYRREAKKLDDGSGDVVEAGVSHSLSPPGSWALLVGVSSVWNKPGKSRQ